MSGIVSSCIVCGAFHATGDIGDDYVKLTIGESTTVLACRKCVPYIPELKLAPCKKCGNDMVRMVFHKGTYQGDHDKGEICHDCIEYAKLEALVKDIKSIWTRDEPLPENPPLPPGKSAA